jgi:hypothetical protein
MKKTIILIIYLTLVGYIFGLENETPSILVELNTGYAIGIDLPSSVPIEIKLVYPFTHFGLTLEAGPLISPDITGIHIFFGPTFFAINNAKIRLPISIGVDMNYKNDSYFGVGGIIGFNYVLAKYLYVGINVEVNYDFSHPYNEKVGERDEYYLDTNDGVVKNRTVPIMENKNHIENNIYIKPTVGIGIQF